MGETAERATLRQLMQHAEQALDVAREANRDGRADAELADAEAAYARLAADVAALDVALARVHLRQAKAKAAAS